MIGARNFCCITRRSPPLEVFTTGQPPVPSFRTHADRARRFSWFARGSYAQAVQRDLPSFRSESARFGIPYLFLGKMLPAEPEPSAEVWLKSCTASLRNSRRTPKRTTTMRSALWKQRRRASRMPRARTRSRSLLRNVIHLLNPKFAAAHFQLGILHSEKKDYSRCYCRLPASHSLADPQMEEAHYRLAQAYRQTRRLPPRPTRRLKLYDQLAKESAQRAERERARNPAICVHAARPASGPSSIAES